MKENFNLSPNCNIDTSVPNKISIRLQPQVTLFKTETKVVLFLLVLFSWIIGGSFFLLGALMTDVSWVYGVEDWMYGPIFLTIFIWIFALIRGRKKQN